MSPASSQILVADGSAELRQLFVFALEDEGYQVTTAETIEQACRLLTEQAFDLVLTASFSGHQDWVLHETAPLLWAAGSTPVILYTGYKLQREYVLAAGYRDLLIKPFNMDAMLDLVRHLLMPAESLA